VSKPSAVISAALTLVFVTWLWLGGMLDQWHAHLGDVSVLTWVTLAAGMLVSYGLRAWRIWREFSDVVGMTWLKSLRIVLTHTALVNLLPMRAGELGFPWLMRKALKVGWLDASASLMWLRVQDACVLATLAIWVWPHVSWGMRLSATGLVWLGVGTIVMSVRRHARKTHDDSAGRLAVLTRALTRRGQRQLQGWLITATNWLLKLTLQAWLLSQLLGLGMDVGWAGSLGAELSALLPVQGLGGIGAYEAGSAAALRVHGVDWSAGLQAALTMHLSLLACSLSFGLLAWWLPEPLVTRHNQA
jgi:hypothetical protein